MADDKPKSSDYVREELSRLDAEQRRIAHEQKRLPKSIAIQLLEGIGPEYDEDSKVHNLYNILSDDERRDLAERRKSRPPKTPPPITKPTITKPTPEALQQDRTPAESLHVPPLAPVKSVQRVATIPSPPPKMTPPRGTAREPEIAPEVLVVDDEPTVVTAISDALESWGIHVWRAQCGIDAIERLYEMPTVDLVILDIWMTPVNGLQFLRIFNKGPWAEKPVVILSGNISGHRDELIEMGAHTVCKKPLSYERLREVVRDALGMKWEGLWA